MQSIEEHYTFRAKREEMRLPGVQPYKSIIINYFNTLFRDDQQSRDFWCCGIKDILKKKYGEGLSATEEEQSYHLLMSLRQIEDANCMLFVRLSVMLGLEWREPERFLSDDSALNAADFDISDLGDIEPTVKQLNIAAMAQGYVLKTKLDGKKIRTSRIEEDLNKGSILSPEALDWAKDQFDQVECSTMMLLPIRELLTRVCTAILATTEQSIGITDADVTQHSFRNTNRRHRSRRIHR